MTLHPRDEFEAPADTARVARAAFPKGNVYMTMHDELGIWYRDSDFAELFTAKRGRPAESPGRLALITVMQFAEGLSDRQAAEAVRARIDWKYALGLTLEDAGFDFSVLSGFRERLLDGGAEQQLLDDMLERLGEQGLLKARGRQRTDSTYVLAAVRTLNRLERVGETLRAALNALAAAAPDWLREQVRADWFDRYGARFEQYRLPKEKKEREGLAQTIGADGYHLLSAIYDERAPTWLREIPAVKILRQVWDQQYCVQEDQVRWRAEKEAPPCKETIQSPYDPEARNRTKRSHNWTGYAVHLTETCDEETPNLITQVETTPATTGDAEMTDVIQCALAEKGWLPSEHWVDSGYIAAEHLVSSRHDHQLELCGPAPADTSWQARSQSGFDITCFAIDWEAQKVTCPQGKTSRNWRPQTSKGHSVIRVSFDAQECLNCTSRDQCTRAKKDPRVLTFRPQAQHQALQASRQRQESEEFKQLYTIRAGVEGTISQGTRSFGLRRSRYIGLAKTHLQQVAIAAAMNLTRAVFWTWGIPKAQTRSSHFASLALGS
jgi:transposase